MSSDDYPRVKKFGDMLSSISGVFAASDIHHLGGLSPETARLDNIASMLRVFGGEPVTYIDTENLDSNIDNILTEVTRLFMSDTPTTVNTEQLSKMFRTNFAEPEDDGEYVVWTGFTKKERQGKMLLGLRLREGLTRKQVAKAIGSNELYIRQYEACVRRIHPGKIPALAKLLCTIEEDFL